MDKRLLVSRSEYFREMLTESKWKEGKTNLIDLRPGWGSASSDSAGLSIQQTFISGECCKA